MNRLKIDQLTKLCRQWQEKLGLAHWKIGLRICSAEELKMHNVQATNEISLTTECALISILDSKDYPDTPFEQDMEVSLVHELARWFSIYFPEYTKVYSDLEAKSGLALMKVAPMPEDIVKLGVKGIIQIWKKENLKGIGKDRLME